MIEFSLLRDDIVGTELWTPLRNHTSGSAGQKGGILMFTAVTDGMRMMAAPPDVVGFVAVHLPWLSVGVRVTNMVFN